MASGPGVRQGLETMKLLIVSMLLLSLAIAGSSTPILNTEPGEDAISPVRCSSRHCVLSALNLKSHIKRQVLVNRPWKCCGPSIRGHTFPVRVHRPEPHRHPCTQWKVRERRSGWSSDCKS